MFYHLSQNGFKRFLANYFPTSAGESIFIVEQARKSKDIPCHIVPSALRALLLCLYRQHNNNEVFFCYFLYLYFIRK